VRCVTGEPRSGNHGTHHTGVRRAVASRDGAGVRIGASIVSSVGGERVSERRVSRSPASNEKAIRLYDRMGFRTRREFSAYVWE
jgi:ribosomal protein S18 acetylase RimI-like enzyme